jgi:hypothetical protein
VTPQIVYYARLTGRDPGANETARVVAAAGVTVCRANRTLRDMKQGETGAVSAHAIGRVAHLSLGEAMPSSDKPTTPPLETVKPPRCAMCRTRMELAGREPGANGAEKRIFKCPKCEFSKTKIVGDPTNAGRYRAPRTR